MATNVHLTPELERFARDCVAEGRYNNVSEVVRSALRLLQEMEEQRRQFTATLIEAEAEADREGTLTVNEVRAQAQAIIDAAKKGRPQRCPGGHSANSMALCNGLHETTRWPRKRCSRRCSTQPNASSSTQRSGAGRP